MANESECAKFYLDWLIDASDKIDGEWKYRETSRRRKNIIV